MMAISWTLLSKKFNNKRKLKVEEDLTKEQLIIYLIEVYIEQIEVVGERGEVYSPLAETSVFPMVGAARFELATSGTPCQRATKLRHAPTIGTHRPRPEDDEPLAQAMLLPAFTIIP